MIQTASYYICFMCGRPLIEMKLVRNEEDPFLGIRMRAMIASGEVMEELAGEVFLCPCGQTNDWFTLVKITKRVSR